VAQPARSNSRADAALAGRQITAPKIPAIGGLEGRARPASLCHPGLAPPCERVYVRFDPVVGRPERFGLRAVTTNSAQRVQS
jgi:hypothetical protein